jgi:hypothetical protein
MAAVSVVAIVVPMVMTPGPIFLLFFRTEFPEVAIAVAMRLVGPAMIVDDLVIVPSMIVGVIRVIYPVIVMFTGDSRQRRSQRACQQ